MFSVSARLDQPWSVSTGQISSRADVGVNQQPLTIGSDQQSELFLHQNVNFYLVQLLPFTSEPVPYSYWVSVPNPNLDLLVLNFDLLVFTWTSWSFLVFNWI